MVREIIIKEMHDINLSQSKLSGNTGISKNQISGFLKGKSLNVDNIEKILSELNLRIVKLY